VYFLKEGKQTTNLASLNSTKLRALPVLIPPEPEQRRIVEAIETHFSRLDDAAMTIEQVERNLKRYRASVLKSAIEGQLVPTEAALAKQERRDYEPASILFEFILAERRRRWSESGKKGTYQEPTPLDTSDLPDLPEGWCWATVDAVGDVLLGRQRAPQYLTGKHSRPYLRVANVRDDALDFSDIEEMDFDEVHFEKYRLRPGDILVSEGQSPHLVGQSAIYHGGIDGLCFQKTLHRFRPFSPGPSAEFAQLVFRAHVKAGVFMRLASITTNIAHLTLVKFQESRFPLPPAAEQVRIVEECARLMSQIDAAESIVHQQLQRCRRLRQSILKWGFEGRLADQDPADEPASVLLERIKAERRTPMTEKSTRLQRGTKKQQTRV
jgi:type I restriction enzyme, S subunit